MQNYLNKEWQKVIERANSEIGRKLFLQVCRRNNATLRFMEKNEQAEKK
jgi:hypothetical protein